MPTPPDSVGEGIVFGLSVFCVRSFVCAFVRTGLVTMISHERLEQFQFEYSTAPPTNDLIRFWRSRFKGQGHSRPSSWRSIQINVAVSISYLLVYYYFNVSHICADGQMVRTLQLRAYTSTLVLHPGQQAPALAQLHHLRRSLWRRVTCQRRPQCHMLMVFCYDTRLPSTGKIYVNYSESESKGVSFFLHLCRLVSDFCGGCITAPKAFRFI